MTAIQLKNSFRMSLAKNGGSGVIVPAAGVGPTGNTGAQGVPGSGEVVTVASTVSASGALSTSKHNPVDATAAVRTMTLPTGQAAGTTVTVEKEDASANAVTITGSIRGVGSSSISLVLQYESITFKADSSGSWWPTAGHKTKTSLDGTYAGRRVTAARLAPSLMLSQPDVMGTPPTIAVTGPGGSTPVTGSALMAYNDTRFTHLGALNVLVNQFSTNYWQNSTNSGDTSESCAVEFDFYGDDFAMLFRCAVTNSSTFWLWVDGKPATAAPVVASANTSGGSGSYYRVTFGSVAHRRIRIYRSLADFGGVYVKPTQAIWPTPRIAPKLFVYGDSWIDGTGATAQISAMAMTIGRLLGMETFIGGQGATGYVAPATGAKRAYTDSARIQKIIDSQADYVLAFGSINDDSLSGIQAAATSVYSQIAAGLPNAKIIVVGPQNLSSSVTANRITNRDAVAAAAAAAPNVIGIVQPTNDDQGLTWVTGTGNSSSPTGTGNADVFHNGAVPSHPTQAGHDYYARRIAQEMSRLLAV